MECNAYNFNKQTKWKNSKSKTVVSLLTVSISNSILQQIQCPKNIYYHLDSKVPVCWRTSYRSIIKCAKVSREEKKDTIAWM